ncbi:tigger transposable element-derived protein 4-like [Parasteatoda tepidariorum]|uniref:tigger transposable element-derived protein 4-like n=1 Tax=Parasteatoda tepidariorum TaxID=114398 RepID=UPI0039BC74AB
MCGEAEAVDMRPVEEWKNGLLKDVLQRYNPCDVFNLDETGANTDGSEKLKPLVIGKSPKPRCFKNVKSLSVSLEANSKSWMTSNVWEKTLKEFEKKFHATSRKVAFVVDNCTAHTEFYSPLIKESFLSSFKRHYRKHLVRDWIKAIDEGREWKLNLLDGINYIHRSWADVTDKIIKNCLRHAGFVESPSSSEDINDDEVPLSELLRQLKERNKDVIDEETYLGIDQNLVTSPELTASEIFQKLSSAVH